MEIYRIGQKYYAGRDYEQKDENGFVIKTTHKGDRGNITSEGCVRYQNGMIIPLKGEYKLEGYDNEAISQYIFDEIDWHCSVTEEIGECIWEFNRTDIECAIESALSDILEW